MVSRLTRISTALAVVAVASVAAMISDRHAYELVRSHGDSSNLRYSASRASHIVKAIAVLRNYEVTRG